MVTGIKPIEHISTNLSYKYKHNENNLDQQANLFADMLLMDSNEVTRQYRKHEKFGYSEIEIIRSLSKIFVVPQVTMWRRIRELGLITEDKERR